jgi:hypothetical protein
VDPNPTVTTADWLHAVDWQSSIVLFGMPENQDASIWRPSIDNILNFIVGYPVGTIDMFQLGRFSSLSCWTVLLKLTTVWDNTACYEQM